MNKPIHSASTALISLGPGRLATLAAFSYLFVLACILPAWFSTLGAVRCVLAAILPAIPAFLLAAVAATTLGRVQTPLPRSGRPGKDAKHFLIPFAVFLALDLVVLVAVYPGLCSTDTEDVFKMILGMPFESNHFRYDTLNNHHPAFYVFVNWLVMKGALALGASQATGAALVAGLHAACMAFACAYTAQTLRRLSGSNTVYTLTLCFFDVNPLLLLYSVTIWKDVLFGAFFLAYLATLLKLFAARGARPRTRDIALAAVFALVCSLLRNNGVMAIVASLVVTAVALKPLGKLFAALAIGLVACYLAITGPVFSLAGVQSGHFAESLSVPLQQIGRTIAEGGTVSPENEALFDQVLPLDQWAEKYRSWSPNSLKFASDFDDDFLEANKGAFLKAWLETGLSNPGLYFAAWMYETCPFWSPTSSTWYFADHGYTLEGVEVQASPLAPFVTYDGLVAVAGAFRTVLAPLYNGGWLAWFMLAVALFKALRKDRVALFALLPLVLYWATYLIAAPANDFRYVLPLYVCIPILCFLCKYEYVWQETPQNAVDDPAL